MEQTCVLVRHESPATVSSGAGEAEVARPGMVLSRVSRTARMLKRDGRRSVAYERPSVGHSINLLGAAASGERGAERPGGEDLGELAPGQSHGDAPSAGQPDLQG